MRRPRRTVMLSMVGALAGVGGGLLKQAILHAKPAGWDEAWERFSEGKMLPAGSAEQISAFEEATDLFEALADQSEGTWPSECLMMAGIAQTWVGNDEGAIGYYERAINEVPAGYGTAVYVYLAQAYQAVGREEDARRMAREFLDRPGGNADTWASRAALRILGEEVDDSPAWQLFSQGKEATDPAERDRLMGEAEVQYLLEAEDRDAQARAGALMMAGLCRDWMEDYEGAIEHYNGALQAMPGCPGAIHIYLAQAHKSLGQTDGAREIAQAFLDNAETLSTADWQVQAAKQILGLGVGDDSQAYAAFEKGRNAGDPEKRRAAMEEAEALYLKTTEGMTGWQRGHALMMAGLCRVWLEDYEGGIRYYEQALNEVPAGGDRATRMYLADALVHVGRLDEAQAQAHIVMDATRADGQTGWTVDSAERILALTPETMGREKLPKMAWDAFCRGKEAGDPTARRTAMLEAERNYLMEADRETGNERAGSLMMAGVCRDWVGDDQGALAHFERALQTAGDCRDDILAYIIMSATAAGRFGRARQAAQQLQKLGDVEQLPDWIQEEASLAGASDELLAQRRTINEEMRTLQNQTGLSEDQRKSRRKELREKMSTLVP